MLGRGAYNVMYRFGAPWETGPRECFYDEVPRWRRRGARAPGLVPGEEIALFGDSFTIERHGQPEPGSGLACFILRARGDAAT